MDMHTHSRFSHDSQCLAEDMAKGQRLRGTCGFAVTDHCDIHRGYEKNVTEDIYGSVEEVKALKNKEENSGFQILTGVEVGEGIWFPEIVQELLGHSSLRSTEVYTHVTNDRLKKVYYDCFPRRD